MIAARYAAMQAAAGNKPERTLIFVLDGGEESGMYGANTAAAYFTSRGIADKVKAVFHTDSNMSRPSATAIVPALRITWGAVFESLNLRTSLPRSTHNTTPGHTAFGNPTNISAAASAGLDYYNTRPRTDSAAWNDADMRVVIDTSIRWNSSSASLYHAPYYDRAYSDDTIITDLGLTTADNMYWLAANPPATP
jgi:hypothetical protein